jgi:hypothetical protein
MKRIIAIVICLLSVATASFALEIRKPRDKEIVIEEFAVRDMPLSEVLVKLADESVKADPKKVGINIVDFTKEPLRSTKLTLKLSKKSVRAIADLIGSTLPLWIHSDGDTIEVRKSESVTRGEPRA